MQRVREQVLRTYCEDDEKAGYVPTAAAKGHVVDAFETVAESRHTDIARHHEI